MRVPNVLYHGTVNTFVPSILHDGLKPSPQNGWDMSKANIFAQMFGVTDPDTDFGEDGYNPIKNDAPGFVYITPDLERARFYAHGKELYYKTKPGGVFEFYGMPFRKGNTAPVISNARAVILNIHTAPIVKSKAIVDPQDHDAFRFKGVIEPKYISLMKGVQI
jgi:hypothetical protein